MCESILNENNGQKRIFVREKKETAGIAWTNRPGAAPREGGGGGENRLAIAPLWISRCLCCCCFACQLSGQSCWWWYYPYPVMIILGKCIFKSDKKYVGVQPSPPPATFFFFSVGSDSIFLIIVVRMILAFLYFLPLTPPLPHLWFPFLLLFHLHLYSSFFFAFWERRSPPYVPGNMLSILCFNSYSNRTMLRFLVTTDYS